MKINLENKIIDLNKLLEHYISITKDVDKITIKYKSEIDCMIKCKSIVECNKLYKVITNYTKALNLDEAEKKVNDASTTN